MALDGAAGRRAAREAEAAIRVDAKVGLMIRLHLVTRLLDEAGLEGIDWRDFAGDNVELRSTIKHRLAGVAPGFGRSVDGVFQAIEEIADIAICVGCGAEDALAATRRCWRACGPSSIRTVNGPPASQAPR